MRLAIFVDQIFWRDGDVLSTDESYILFPASFVDAGAEITFIGRLAPAQGRAPYVLDQTKITFHPLPFYTSLYDLWRKGPTIYGDIRQRIREAAKDWDAIIISGPHPIGQLIARDCLAAGVPVVPLLRQNLVQWMGVHRGLKGLIAVAVARLLDWDFKRLARGRSVLVVGKEMAIEYSRYSNHVHNHFPCLVDDESFAMFAAMAPAGVPERVLCVGRLSPEMGHRYLFEALALLRSRDLTLHLDVVGDGALHDELRDLVTNLDLTGQVTFHGYVPYGPLLFEFYQNAGVLVRPSLTEGFPQVINESLCVGVPTVASNVGGIPSFLTDEESALLVPPADSAALADAIERVVRDPMLRGRLRENGRALMRCNTLEANRALVMGVIRNDVLAATR
jgi:glycosyltransferase involved in cell wall biosynthesis